MTDQKPGNPAVVGLAGFGTTTLLLQFHNLGMAGAGVLLWTALFFGGLAQLAAGLKEYETGNNFGFAAFSTYGAFWMALAGIYAGMHFGILTPSTTDIGWFLVAFTAPTIVYTLAACRVSGAHSLLFVTLLIGFIGLDLESHCYVRTHTLCRDCALHYGRNRTGRFRLEAAHGERLAGPQEISSLSTEAGGDTSFLEKLGLMAWTDRPATLGLRSVRRSAPTNRILIDYRLLLALSIYQG